MKKILLAIILVSFAKTYSQTNYAFVYNNDSILKKGISLHDAKKYDEAIKEYEKISKTDPKFFNAQYEKAISLRQSDKKEEFKSFIESLYTKNVMPEFPELYAVYANYLSDEKEYDKSEKIFKEGEKYLPNSSSFLYNLAILYVRKGETQKSVDILERIITNNPNHPSSHFFLGSIALENGKITEGTLALMSYLIIAPTGPYAEAAILKLNAKYGQNYLDESKVIFSKTGDNFEEIETILRNQLPLKSAYKVKSNIDDVITRQVQAVAEYTLEHKMGDGFFETIYIPWVKTMMEENQFEGYSYYMLVSMEEKLGKTLTKNVKKITSFNENYIKKSFWSKYAKRNLDIFGKQEDVVITLENGRPYLIGPQINGKSEGKYKYLNSDGNLKGEINFKNNLLDGHQKYYDDKGNLSEEKYFINGKLEGTRTTYYKNGSIDLVENYKDGLLDGICTSYYPNGGKNCEITFTGGKRNGKLICLYQNGGKKSETGYENGKLNGNYLEYNVAGDIVESANYVNDVVDGKSVQYYDGKTVKNEVTYKNGVVQESYKSYYSNKTLERESTFSAGKIVKLNDYFPNGKKSTELTYDQKGQLEAYSYFDINGNKYYDEKYKSGELKYGLQYSDKNAKPKEISLSQKPFEIKTYEGKVVVYGNYEKGNKNGEWNYNYRSGNPKSKEFYSRGKLHGLYTAYNQNGNIDNIRNYANDTINGTFEVYEDNKLNRTFYYQNNTQNGPFKSFYSDGTTSIEGYFINGDLNFKKYSYSQNGVISIIDNYVDGYLISKEYYNQKGIKENEIDYKNKTGKFVLSHNNGTVIQDYNLKNGVFNGAYTLKDKLNTPITTAEYLNGKLHNSYKSYSPSGSIYTDSNYYSGDINGMSKQYDLVGNLRLTTEYTFGDENGKTIRYYHNKTKLSEYNELNGLTEGEYIYYNQKGEPILAIGYTNNQPMYYTRKSKTGELNDKVIIENETAEVSSYYPNGKVAIQLNLLKGNLDGKLVIYNMESKPEYESMYKNSILDGDRIEYYANGKIYKKEHFVKNDFEGIQEYFKEDGKPWLKSAYKNGELHGNTLIYKEGKLVLTKKYDSNELVNIAK
ncbi:tetratricopeptide repeat protein [Flavobacterium sp. PL02]|uniref:tetratricopeptide repeat protein n=1 Tax=Flavobacterium sp. PL02 TaxID=3088354 RepID=UPI002B2223AE|nr:tetratricopeptide repeat protein [Flavobacterium sp. PL02]MEA9411998.1 tetratricopeptide repeat protein [Flavobacterium sp. PL02]